MVNIIQTDGGAFPKTIAELKAAVDPGDPAIGTLACYESTPPHIYRYFCKLCSAWIFYTLDNRPQIVDLPIGLLAAPDGARAEVFLSWRYRDSPNWRDNTQGGWREWLVDRVVATAEEFRILRAYPKSWKRLQAETSNQIIQD